MKEIKLEGNDVYQKMAFFIKHVLTKRLESSVFEIFDELHIYSKSQQIQKLDNSILKFANFLNEDFPFVSYHFNNGEFNEQYYFDYCGGVFLGFLRKDESYYLKFSNTEKDSVKQELTFALINKNIEKYEKFIEKEFRMDFMRSKILESLLKKKKEIIEKIDFYGRTKPEESKHIYQKEETQFENKETDKPKEFAYIKIGVLIAEGKLTKNKKVYEYKNNTFNKIELEKELKKDLKIKSIRQYIEGTFGADTKTTLKNDLLRHQPKIKNIVAYCKFYKKQITQKYQSLFDELE
jgi:hypothetical protein